MERLYARTVKLNSEQASYEICFPLIVNHPQLFDSVWVHSITESSRLSTVEFDMLVTLHLSTFLSIQVQPFLKLIHLYIHIFLPCGVDFEGFDIKV